jgi:UDP-N-acetylglucosamine acyltransferase
MSTDIHPTAIVDPKAELSSGVQVGPYSVIGPNVVLHANCRIASHVVIEGHTTIGEGTEVFQFASVGSKPQDLKYRGEASTLVIGARNQIREYATLQPGTENGNMTTIVGDDNLFMANSHVGHDCVVGSNNVFANSVALAGHVTVNNYAILGGLVGVHQFARLGDFVMLGAGSMVGNDVPPFCIGQGDRCFLRGINTIGMQRNGYSAEQIADIKKIYRILFSASGSAKDNIANIPEDIASTEHVRKMTDFLVDSERGIMSRAKNSA